MLDPEDIPPTEGLRLWLRERERVRLRRRAIPLSGVLASFPPLALGGGVGGGCGDGRVDFDTFFHKGAAPFFRGHLESLRRAFRLFCKGSSDGIDGIAFAEVLCKLSIPGARQPDEISRMFAAADTNGDGVISFDEFVHVVTRSGSASGW